VAALAVAALVAIVVPATSAQAATTPAAGIQVRIAHSQKCLNVSGASVDNNAKIVQYGCVGASVTNDKFVLVPRGQGRYWIQGVGSRKCLNVAGNSMADGGLIIQYACGTQLNTAWEIEEVLDQPTVRIRSASSDKCLNLPNSQTANNVQLIQYTCTRTGAANEKFYLPPTSSPTAVRQPFTSKQPVSVVQGVAPAEGGVAPVNYSYIRADNQLQIITDRNPDPENTDPAAPEPVFRDTVGAGFTGQAQSARLGDGRVQVVAHDAAAGDVNIADETVPGTGNYDRIWDIGGSFAGQPEVGPLTADRLATYAIINGQLWFSPQAVNNPDTAYGAWRNLGGTGLTGTPVVVQTRIGARIFALDNTGKLTTAALENNSLSDWTSLGGTGFTTIPTVVVNPGYTSSVFIRSADGTVVTKKQNADNTFPADWTPLPALPIVGSPSAVMDEYPGRIAVSARGTDNLIYLSYELAQNTGEFSDWFAVSDVEQPESLSASDPTAFAYDVPSGPSFGIAFQSTADLDVPFIFTFESSRPATNAKSKATAKGAVPTAERHQLDVPAKQKRLTN
jgi:hypothetical protein